ncbi:nucleoplasmin-like protein ANO39 [Acanthaster planci]|uniref:Nucleoplasmin-like protein ANO39 n=1 Tax=Acanthaster planci TaxID=133434 RepID=A0A8B7YJJ3_ACAPL|nr:nucleoplasmin-like protein ANO39 [Acanthaster planci]
MSKEYFWGDSLTGSKKEIKWNPSLEDEDDFDNLDGDGIQHFLFLKQAVLGPGAEEAERNVVEIETDNFDGDSVKQPLFSLKLGLNESSPLDIGVQPPVTFTLTSGSGPVYLSGQHMIEISADEGDEELEEEEEEDDDLEINASPELPAAKSKKRPLSTSEGTAKKPKMAKLDKDTGKDEDEEDEDEDNAEMAEIEDDEDDEDDEDFEDEDEDDDDSDEEDEEDEEEEDEDDESPEKPAKRKVASKKGQMNGAASAKGDSKAVAKALSKPPKAKGKKKVLGLDEIKGKIKESTSVPKKEEKFKNYLRSAFHISEAKKLQDLWGWYRASLQK